MISNKDYNACVSNYKALYERICASLSYNRPLAGTGAIYLRHELSCDQTSPSLRRLLLHVPLQG